VRCFARDELEARVREEVLERLLAEHEPIEDAHAPALREELLDDVGADVAAAAHHEDGTVGVAVARHRPDLAPEETPRGDHHITRHDDKRIHQRRLLARGDTPITAAPSRTAAAP